MWAWMMAALAGGEIQGFVFDADGRPVSEVEVRIGDRSVRTVDGRFSASVDTGKVQISVGSGSVHVQVADGGTTEVLVTLGETTSFLTEEPLDVGRIDEAVELRWLRGRVFGPAGPVVGARVFARGVPGMVRTDENGHYELEVPAGPRTLVVVQEGFSTLETVTEDSVVDVTLKAASRALAAYTVTAPYLEGSVAGLLDARKEGSAVADVLGAEEMKRSGDSDAASALARVTGLTVVGGKYVFVRGLGDRYSSSLFNGGSLPSPEPERRVVPLDLFPTSVLSGVIVQKSWSPDMPGEFGGGVIQLETIEPPTEWVASAGISGGLRTGTTGTQGLAGQTSFSDALGIDGGQRALPDVVAQASASSPLEEGDRFSERGYTADELESFGEAMPNRWSPKKRSLPPGFSVRGSIGDGFEGDRVSGGVMGAFTFSNDWKRRTFDRTYYVPGQDNVLRSQHRYGFDETVNGVNFGGFVTGGLDVGKKTQLRYTGMLSRSTDHSARIYEGYNDDVGQDIRVSRVRWVERQLAWHQLRGAHTLGPWTVDWHGIASRASRKEPDRTETRYDNEPGTDRWLLSDRPEGNGRFFSRSSEATYEAKVDVAWRMEKTGPMLKAGTRVTTRSRGVDTRRFKYFHKGDASRDAETLVDAPEQVFTPANIGSDGFQFEEFTRATDNYSASHSLLAAYVMGEFPVASWLTINGGTRVERSAQDVSTFELFNPSQTPVSADLTTLDVLPAASVTWAPEETIRVRLGGARTVSRPDFRELSPATFNDVTGGRQTFGNPELGRAQIDHLDARFEWFPRSGEVVSVSAFAKRFSDPVETVVVPSAQQSVTWANADGATNVGVEVEVRRTLPANFWAAANVALIRSRIQLGEGSGIQTSAERALQGQSPWMVNAQFGWSHPERADRLTVLLNAVGPRITEVGALGAPDIREVPVPVLDVVAKKAVSKRWSAGLSLGNLLDVGTVTRQGPEQVDRVRQGVTVGASLGWSAD